MKVVQNPLRTFGRTEQVGDWKFHVTEFITVSHFLELSALFSRVIFRACA